MNSYKTVIFDLDGTIADTSIGIVQCVEHTIKELGLPEIKLESKLNFVGPPLLESFQRECLLSEQQARQAVSIYRKRYENEGLFEAEIYTGIKDVLAKLNKENFKIGIATLKREDFAKKMMQHFNLYHYFNSIVGIDNNDLRTKADTIRICMSQITTNASDQVLMVGDSKYDFSGASEVNIDFCGVTYGFGFNKESVMGKHKIDTPIELLDIIF